MKLTTTDELLEQSQKLWASGLIYSSLVDETPCFPIQLKLKKPTSREITERSEEIRAWVANTRSLESFRIEMSEVNHRVFGKNRVPNSIWIDSLEQMSHLLGTQEELKRFQEILLWTRTRRPGLLEWLAKNPFLALAQYHDWCLILDVIDWINDNPRPGMYIREISLPGIHTKFIENRKTILSELFNSTLSVSAIDFSFVGNAQFEQRYGFKCKPLRVRFRVLDPSVAFLPTPGEQDMTLDLDSFKKLDPNVSRVFVTENEINYLSFPVTSKSMIIFGGGYGIDLLKTVNWLTQREIFYWGDIDTHGFAILNSLRQFLPHAHSIFMDEKTLLAHRDAWGGEKTQIVSDSFHLLRSEEQLLYKNLIEQKFRERLRLEQEQIEWSYVRAKLAALPLGENH